MTELKDIKDRIKAAAVSGMRKSISLGSRGGVGEYQLSVICKSSPFE